MVKVPFPIEGLTDIHVSSRDTYVRYLDGNLEKIGFFFSGLPESSCRDVVSGADCVKNARVTVAEGHVFIRLLPSKPMPVAETAGLAVVSEM